MSDSLAQSASETRIDSGSDEHDGDRRLLTVGSVAVAALSVVGSLVGYAVLPSKLRIHWTLGFGSYYGPEFASKPLVLALFPAVVIGGALLGWWAVGRLRSFDGSTRPYDAIALLGTLAVVFGAQVAIILLNI